MELQFKLTHPNAKVPTKAHSIDAGFDLTAVSIDITDSYIEYDTGLAISLPPGYAGLLFPRSSVSKYDLSLCNCVGLVDPGYLGSIKLRFRTTKPQDNKLYTVGDRIGQLVVIKTEQIEFKQVESFEQTERQSGGFGSSGS